MRTKRVTINWTDISEEMAKGILVLDTWENLGSICLDPKRTHCECSITRGSTGMQGIGKNGVVVKLSKEEYKIVHALMEAYFAGVSKRERIYHWFF